MSATYYRKLFYFVCSTAVSTSARCPLQGSRLYKDGCYPCTNLASERHTERVTERDRQRERQSYSDNENNILFKNANDYIQTMHELHTYLDETSLVAFQITVVV